MAGPEAVSLTFLFVLPVPAFLPVARVDFPFAADAPFVLLALELLAVFAVPGVFAFRWSGALAPPRHPPESAVFVAGFLADFSRWLGLPPDFAFVGFLPLFSALAAMSATACSTLRLAGSASFGSVALILPCFT